MRICFINTKMDNKITFDLRLFEIAFNKAIEIINSESNLLSKKVNIKPDELEKLSSEKEDIMNFIDWHIPLIVRYIKMHKGDLDDIQDLADLAIRAKVINSTAQAELQKKTKLTHNESLARQKVSTITVMIEKEAQESIPILEAIFENDSDEMPKKITKLLKDMFAALENNFNKLMARKNINDQIFQVISKAMKEENQINYSPKKRKKNIQGNLLYNEDC